MSDATAGDRVDQAIAAAREALSDLQAKVGAKAEEVGEDVTAAIDALSAKVDEIQAAWAARE